MFSDCWYVKKYYLSVMIGELWMNRRALHEEASCDIIVLFIFLFFCEYYLNKINFSSHEYIVVEHSG
jgi:hypothetical protein